MTNVVLAGDHVRTGLPASIEGAVRSGEMAAKALLAARPPGPSDGGEGRPTRIPAVRERRAGSRGRSPSQKNA